MRNAVPSQHQAPKNQGCFFLSSQLHSLFSKQYLLQNHKLGDCSDVESIFITVGEDLGVKNSQIYWVAEHSPDPPRPSFSLSLSWCLLLLGEASMYSWN